MEIFILFFAAFSLVLIIALVVYKNTRLVDNSWKDIARAKILELENTNLHLDQKLIKADKLLEFVMKKYFREEQNIGTLLKKHKTKFDKKELNSIWEAHKLRNKLAHDINFYATDYDKKQSISVLLYHSKRLLV